MKFRKDMVLLAGCCALLLAVLFALGQLRNADAAKPASIVTTFKGDPKTSRAFTWSGDGKALNTVVQVVEGEMPAAWEEDAVMTFTGQASTISVGEGEMRSAHKAEATGLKPGTLYTYRVGTGEDKEWSEPAAFVTEGSKEVEFTFINVTDSQGETKPDFALWGNTLGQAFRVFPEAKFIVHNGDLTENPEDEEAWKSLFAEAAPWITRIPLMPVTGNHDEVNGAADRFVSHFNVPGNGANGSIEGTTYSFDYGSVHFVMLNTESNLKEQAEWLKEDLDSTEQPWKIVSVHRGAYGGSSYKKLSDWVEVFDEYKVDLVLQGHNHEYARSYPLRDGQVTGDGDSPARNREGTVYVVTNTSGPKFNEKKEDQFYHKVHFQNGKQMFVGITIKGDSLTYQAFDVTGEKLDEFVIMH